MSKLPYFAAAPESLNSCPWGPDVHGCVQMAMMDMKNFAMPSAAQLLDAARGLWAKDFPEDRFSMLEPIKRDEEVGPRWSPTSQATDQSRYQRLLDYELDRQLLSEVEREDQDILSRVRDALYADD